MAAEGAEAERVREAHNRKPGRSDHEPVHSYSHEQIGGLRACHRHALTHTCNRDACNAALSSLPLVTHVAASVTLVSSPVSEL